MMLLQRLKIGSRLHVAFGLLLVLLAALGGLGLNRLAAMRADIRALTRTEWRAADVAQRVIDVSNNNAQAKMELFFATSREQIDALQARMKRNRQAINAGYAQLDSLLTDSAQKALVQQARSARKRYTEATDSMTALLNADRTAEAARFMSSTTVPTLQAYLPILQAVVDAQEEHVKTRVAASEARYQTGLWWTVALLLLALVAAGALAAAIARSITRPLARLRAISDRLAQGDVLVDVEVSGRDELSDVARSLARMAEGQAQVARAATRLSQGDLAVELRARGEQDELTGAFVVLQDTLSRLLREMAELSHAAAAGDLGRRGEASAFGSAFRELVAGMNSTLDALGEPVREAASVLNRLAERDLTARVTGEYRGEHGRIREAVNATALRLSSALSEVRQASAEVADAAAQVGEGSEALAQGASEQASSLEQVAGAVHQLEDMTRQNASSAQDARDLVDRARASADRSQHSMDALSDVMGRIKESSDATARIVRTIDEIAFQTNLLALNAAVEAARAGDAGRGFAVVAEEVRGLAHRSAEAARSTAQLIEGALTTVEGGVATNARVLEELAELRGQVDTVGDVMAGIASASEEQSESVRRIASALEEMNGLTQVVASNSEESAAAAQELSAQSDRLKDVVGGFRLPQLDGPGARPLPQQSMQTRRRAAAFALS